MRRILAAGATLSLLLASPGGRAYGQAVRAVRAPRAARVSVPAAGAAAPALRAAPVFPSAAAAPGLSPRPAALPRLDAPPRGRSAPAEAVLRGLAESWRPGAGRALAPPAARFTRVLDPLEFVRSAALRPGRGGQDGLYDGLRARAGRAAGRAAATLAAAPGERASSLAPARASAARRAPAKAATGDLAVSGMQDPDEMEDRSVVVLRLLGIPIKATPGYLFGLLGLGVLGAIAIVQADAFAQPLFQLVVRGWGTLATSLSLVYVSILVHELGHALVYRLYAREVRIILGRAGGWARHDSGRSFLAVAAGPAAGLAAAWAYGSWGGALAAAGSPFAAAFLVAAALTAAGNLMNALPTHPGRDGGRLLQLLFGYRGARVLAPWLLLLGGLAWMWWAPVTPLDTLLAWQDLFEPGVLFSGGALHWAAAASFAESLAWGGFFFGTGASAALSFLVAFRRWRDEW